MSSTGNQSLTLRLATTSNNNTGIVEVYDGVSGWGKICWLSRMDSNVGDAVCRHLGFKFATFAFRHHVLRGSIAYMNGLLCGSLACSLKDSVAAVWLHSYQSCSVGEVFGVSCSGQIDNYNHKEQHILKTNNFLSLLLT